MADTHTPQFSAGKASSSIYPSVSQAQQAFDGSHLRLESTLRQSDSLTRKRQHHVINESDHDDLGLYTDDAFTEDDDELAYHSHKKSRPSPRSSDCQPTVSPDRATRHGSGSPARRPGLHQRRHSRFIEGSMRDRTSQKPPSIFIRDERDQEQEMEQDILDEQLGIPRRSHDTVMSYDAGIESAKSSGMYRFGKAIVNAMNPANYWGGFNTRGREKFDPRYSIEQHIADERKFKAEEAYADLKRGGYPGTLKGLRPASEIHLPLNSFSNQQRESITRPARFSLQEVQQQPFNHLTQPPSLLTQPQPTLLPSTVPSPERSPLPSPTRVIQRKASKSQISPLKRVKSLLHLPVPKRMSTVSPIPSMYSELTTDSAQSSILKKSPSKKDLHKQQKLIKKISNLEGKLQNARHHLLRSLEDAPPVPEIPLTINVENDVFNVGRESESSPEKEAQTFRPRRFVPGELPSLPSESLLHPQARETNRQVGEKVLSTTFNLISQASQSTPSLPGTLDSEGKVKCSTDRIGMQQHSNASTSNLAVSLQSRGDFETSSNRSSTNTTLNPEKKRHAPRDSSSRVVSQRMYTNDMTPVDKQKPSNPDKSLPAQSDTPTSVPGDKPLPKRNAWSKPAHELQPQPEADPLTRELPAQPAKKHKRTQSRTNIPRGPSVLAESVNGQVFTASPEKDRNVPPMPRLPKSMTLAKGEKDSAPGKENVARQIIFEEAGEEGQQVGVAKRGKGEDWVWDDDVF